MAAPLRPSAGTSFTRTRGALAADRPRAAGAVLAMALLAIAMWCVWAVRTRLELAPEPGSIGAATGEPARGTTPAALTLRAAGPRPRGR